ncbi:toll-like receptor 2 [Saccostrea echinata]|uniref:toll-like receptor 2 n=1 Tax=Saccostrea echinata TaxID=191078 RepID=UPI002A808B62|nr:toll-like receptor 2 [Saccostrea echinata]
MINVKVSDTPKDVVVTSRTRRIGQHSVQSVKFGQPLLVNESLDENYETCHEELEETQDESLLSVDELGHELNSSIDRDVKEILANVASLVTLIHIKSKKFTAVVDTAAQVSVMNLQRARELGLDIDDSQPAPAEELDLPDHFCDSHVVHLGLSGNPFYCTCDLVWFRGWIHKNSQKLVEWPSNYTCSLPKEWVDKSLVDFHLDFSFCHPPNPYIIVAISVSIVLLLTVIISSVLYQKRWQIKYHLYLLRAKRRGYDSIGHSEFVYDIFVAYNHADSIWFISELIPRLEKQEKLKLCLHERDFEIGKLIVDNIIDTVHNSRKVLIILSNAFARSQWCQFESTLAQSRSMNNGERSVIVIVKESINIKNMNKSLDALLKTTTFIEWPNDKTAKDMFWNRVVSAVKS